MKNPKLIFIILGVLFLFLGFTDDPMSLEFALWMFALAFTVPLQKFFSRFPPLRTFFFVGFLVGIFAELFAVFGSLDVPAGERVLMGQSPKTDLIFGLFYYSMLMCIWTFLVHRYSYTRKEIFVLTGLLGIATEGVGAVFVGLITNPIGFGGLYALIVFCVYGIFPYIAFLTIEGRVTPTHAESGNMKKYGMAILGMFLFIALFGNYLLPLLRQIFGT